jgi:quercetin dioxygenase-like cupin family protein
MAEHQLPKLTVRVRFPSPAPAELPGQHVDADSVAGEVVVSVFDTTEHPAEAVEAAPGLWRTSLQQHDLSVPGRVLVQVRVDIEPSSPPVRHFHPGEEVIAVLAGSLEYAIDGQVTKVYSAGEALTVPTGVVHSVRNVGDTNGVELATYIVEPDKPLLTVVP